MSDLTDEDRAAIAAVHDKFWAVAGIETNTVGLDRAIYLAGKRAGAEQMRERLAQAFNALPAVAAGIRALPLTEDK